ncbi:MAG: alkaline phosphatase D family protein [Candidatus Hinthialibacter antarcticus]|nr:alkaline phosphatase D family protein [Candidatus Hinthialibacter antarcticus]
MKRLSYPLAVFLVAAFMLCADAQQERSIQYKKETRLIFDAMDAGKLDAAVAEFNQFLKEYPNDLECYFGLAAAYSLKGDIPKAMENVDLAVGNGLSFGRFLAGPREWFANLYESEAYQSYAQTHHNKYDDLLVHGPLLGCVDHQSAKFWVRTMELAGATVNLSETPNMQTGLKTAWSATKPEDDFTVVLSIDGLKPNTRYYYEIYINGIQKTPVYSFRTFLEPNASAQFSVAFGGGAGFTPPYEYMWNTIAAHDPLAFLFMGDNVYIDNPTSPNVQKYCYYRRQSRPEFRNFVAQRSNFAIWDDHDFVDNDKWGGPDTFSPEWKLPVWNVFKQNWNNPSYGGGETQPGCWFSYSIGDVDFIMLDGRYYRDDPKTPTPSMLGPVQKKWLFDTLKQCKGTFKVIASPVPWSYGAKPGSRDPWQGYKEEREEIFSFLEANKIDGVLLISADRHRSDLWKIERENGYDLYEFESSKLTNIHTHGIMPGSIFGYNDTCSFAQMNFDTTKDDPTVAMEIYSIDDELIHKMTLKKSQISYK